MILTAADLLELTGLRRPSAQIRWLAARGWRFEVRADGRPVVSAGEFARRMEGAGKRAARDSEPDLAAVFRAG